MAAVKAKLHSHGNRQPSVVLRGKVAKVEGKALGLFKLQVSADAYTQPNHREPRVSQSKPETRRFARGPLSAGCWHRGGTVGQTSGGFSLAILLPGSSTERTISRQIRDPAEASTGRRADLTQVSFQ